MSSRLTLTALALVALAGAAYALTLPTVGGENLAVIMRLRPDNHLLTAWLLPFASRIFGSHLAYLRIVNLVAAALLAVVTIAGRTNRAAWATLVVLLITSPLIVGVLLDPLGSENLVSLGLVLLAAADTAGTHTIRPLTRFVLTLALVLQDPSLSPAAVLYALLTAPPLLRSIAPLAGAGLAIVARAYAVMMAPLWPPAADLTAGPVTAIATGAFLFGVAPLFLLGVRQRLPTVAALAGAPLLRCALLAVAVGCAGLLSATGDPSPYWLGAEGCLIIGGIASALQRGTTAPREIVTAAVATLTAQVLAFLYFLPTLPSLEISRSTSVVEQVLGSPNVPSGACIVSDEAGREHVLADGALLLSRGAPASAVVDNADTCTIRPAVSALTVLSDMSAENWGAGGVALLRAALSASGPGVLPIGGGIISPRARASTPTGQGAFGNIIETPNGTVGQFTVLTGFSYLFPCARAGRRLTFAVAPADAHGAYAYRVLIVVPRGALTLSTAIVPSTPRTNSIQPWQWRSVALPRVAECRGILFSAPVEPGITGAWVMFAGATVH